MKLNKFAKRGLVLAALIILGGVAYAGPINNDNNNACGGNCAGCNACSKSASNGTNITFYSTAYASDLDAYNYNGGKNCIGCREYHRRHHDSAYDNTMRWDDSKEHSVTIYKWDNMPSKILVTKGEVVAITDQGGVTVKGEGNQPLVTLNYSKDTEVVNGINGKELKFKNLKVGDKVTAYYSTKMTRSIPPQTKAYSIVVGDSEKEKIGRYVMVKDVVFENNAAVVTDVNGDLVVTINGNAYDDFRDIEEGDELLVWYDMMTMSLPAQANATKAVEID